MSVPIDEIFGARYNGRKLIGGTIQGEGAQAGQNSVFVRTGGCNLTCSGFGCTLKSPLDNETVITGCDSIHAVNVKHFRHTWTYYDTAKELIEAIKEHVYMPGEYSEKPAIIFTGGEPLIHHSDPALLGAIEYFSSRGHKIVFETNATQYIEFDKYPIFKEVTFSMSVKMSSSGERIDKRWKPEVANEYLKNTKDSYFKFVLSAKSIKEESQEVFEFLDQVPTYSVVYCMPLGETAKEVEENAKEVYEFCAINGFRYSDRLHIRIYNDLRGV